jgi:hypothetical protein
MSAAPTDHSDEVAPAHDLAAEVAHARHHAVENNWFFLAFFSIVGLAVLSYEFTANGPWEITILAILRCALIAVFLFSLVKRFNFVIAAFIFTALFFIGMVFLSWWSSTIPQLGDPIVIKSEPPHR